MKLIVTYHQSYNKLPQGGGNTKGYSSEILAPHLSQQNYNFRQNHQEQWLHFLLNFL